MPTPEYLSSQTTNSEEIHCRDHQIFWKIKGLVGKLTYKLNIKYGDPSICEDKTHIKSFANIFVLKYQVPLLESHLQIVLSKKTQLVGNKKNKADAKAEKRKTAIEAKNDNDEEIFRDHKSIIEYVFMIFLV